jgi:hypothetical protein
VFESRVLRRIFGAKREGVTRSLRKLHIEELHNLYSSPNNVNMFISKMDRACHTHGRAENRRTYKASVEKPEGETDH